MKKILLSISAIVALSLTANNADAQVIKGFYKQSYKERNNGTFDKGTSLLSFGIGPAYNYLGYKNALPPVYVKYEMGIMDEVGVGIVGGLGMGKHSTTKDGFFNTSIGVIGYYHFNKFIPVKKLDAYAGVGIGLGINNRTWDNSTNISVGPLFKVGARYYFTNSFGVYVESGYDNLSVANLGITLRF